MNINVGEK